jgi:hypothetical protein
MAGGLHSSRAVGCRHQPSAPDRRLREYERRRPSSGPGRGAQDGSAERPDAFASSSASGLVRRRRARDLTSTKSDVRQPRSNGAVLLGAFGPAGVVPVPPPPVAARSVETVRQISPSKRAPSRSSASSRVARRHHGAGPAELLAASRHVPRIAKPTEFRETAGSCWCQLRCSAFRQPAHQVDMSRLVWTWYSCEPSERRQSGTGHSARGFARPAFSPFRLLDVPLVARKPSTRISSRARW